MPKVKDNKLTAKEKKAVEVYVATGSKSEAIRQASPDVLQPNDNISVFKRPRVKQATEEALTALGITTEKIIRRFDNMADTSRNDMAKLKANENLANLADLYPDKNADIDINQNGIAIHFDY